jgi:hypothetical protein
MPYLIRRAENTSVAGQTSGYFNQSGRKEKGKIDC